MARTARKVGSSGIYHVLLRGNDKLFGGDSDVKYFRTLADKYFGEECALLGMRIFENKVHLAIKENGAALTEVIKPLCTSYARYCNRTRETNGKLFRGRYKSEPVESEKELLSALKYIYRGFLDGYENDDLIKKKFSREKIEKAESCLCMDDYEAMSAAELSDVIEYLCGSDDFKKLGNAEKAALFHKADAGGRVRIGLVLKALDVPYAAKSRPPKNKPPKIKAEKKTQKQEKKKELSVWLL